MLPNNPSFHYTAQSPFMFWVQKVLPLAFDDALSYYEAIAKMRDKLNETIQRMNETGEAVESLSKAYTDLSAYVQEYFDNLDLQSYVSEAFSSSVRDGSLYGVLYGIMSSLTSPVFADSESDMTVPYTGFVLSNENAPGNVYLWTLVQTDPFTWKYTDSGYSYGGVVSSVDNMMDKLSAYVLKSSNVFYTWNVQSQSWTSTEASFLGIVNSVSQMNAPDRVYVLKSDSHIWLWNGSFYEDSGLVYGENSDTFTFRTVITNPDNITSLSQSGWYIGDFSALPSVPYADAPDTFKSHKTTILVLNNQSGKSIVVYSDNNEVWFYDGSWRLTPRTDNSLSKPGYPADAAVTGQFISDLDTTISNEISRASNAETDITENVQQNKSDIATNQLLISNLDKRELEHFAATSADILSYYQLTLSALSLLQLLGEVNSAYIACENFSPITTENNNHLTGLHVTPRVDYSLSVSGIPADAATVGENIDRIDEAVAINSGNIGLTSGNLQSVLTNIGTQPDNSCQCVNTSQLLLTQISPANTNISAENSFTLCSENLSPISCLFPFPKDSPTVDYLITQSHTLTHAFSQLNNLDQFSFIQGGSNYHIPVIYLYGNLSSISRNNPVTLQFNIKNFSLYKNSGTLTAKLQGSSSLNFPEPNYTLDFPFPLAPLPYLKPTTRWNLKANFHDPLQFRGLVCAEIWRNLVSEYLPEASNLNILTENHNPISAQSLSPISYSQFTSPIMRSPGRGATDGIACFLYINDSPVGIYTWQISKSPYMFGMDSPGSGRAVLGFKYSNFNTVYNSDSSFLSDIDVEYSDSDLSVSDLRLSYNNLINAIHNVSSQSNISALNDLIDVHLSTLYFLFSAAIGNSDGLTRNLNLYTFDRGSHWNISAYDLDETFGLFYGWNRNLVPGSGKDSWDLSNTFQYYPSRNGLMRVLWNYNKSYCLSTWKSLRQNFLSDRYVNFLWNKKLAEINAYAQMWDFLAWPSKHATSLSNIGQALTWYYANCAYLDSIS